MISKITFAKNISVWLLLILCLVIFQNCGKGFEVGDMPLSASYQATVECFANGAVDACIYQKNVVQQAGAAVASDTANQYQNFGVKLSEQSDSQTLSSPSFTVMANAGVAQKIDGSWKFNYHGHAGEFAQVSAYYFLTDFKNYFKRTAGIFYAENQSIKVITDSSFSSWSGSAKEINLEIQDDKMPAALDASVVVNLLAHANAYYAGAGAALDNQSTTTQACYNKKSVYVPYACCKTSSGCGPSLLAGQADYATAVYFASTNLPTAIGESWGALTEGLSTCGISRDVAKNTALTAATAYAACASYGSNGNIYAMGAVYASIWWEVRKKVADKNNFDLFFMKHLEVIRGDDTLTTIQTKLQTLDTAQFSGKYFVLMQTEFQRRGL